MGDPWQRSKKRLVSTLLLNFILVIFLLQSIIAIAMVLSGTINSLIDFFSFTAWIFYGGAMLALIVMRFTRPNFPRPYKVFQFNYILFLFLYLYFLKC